MYYLYADLGGTYCERYASTASEAKQLLFHWITNDGIFGPFPINRIKVFKIKPEMKDESCIYRLSHGKPVRFSFDVTGILLEVSND